MLKNFYIFPGQLRPIMFYRAVDVNNSVLNILTLIIFSVFRMGRFFRNDYLSSQFFEQIFHAFFHTSLCIELFCSGLKQ